MILACAAFFFRFYSNDHHHHHSDRCSHTRMYAGSRYGERVRTMANRDRAINFCCYSSGDRDAEEKDRHSSALAKLLIPTDAIAAFHLEYDHLFPANESSNGHRSQINIKRLQV